MIFPDRATLYVTAIEDRQYKDEKINCTYWWGGWGRVWGRGGRNDFPWPGYSVRHCHRGQTVQKWKNQLYVTNDARHERTDLKVFVVFENITYDLSRVKFWKVGVIPSFGMTTTKTLRSVFSWRASYVHSSLLCTILTLGTLLIHLVFPCSTFQYNMILLWAVNPLAPRSGTASVAGEVGSRKGTAGPSLYETCNCLTKV